MRHILAILLMILVGLFSVEAQAANTLTIESGQGLRGSTGNGILVNLSSDVAIIGVQFDVEYNSQVFSIADIDSTERSEHFGGGFFWNVLYPGMVRVMMLDLELDPLPAGTGAIAEVSFNIFNGALPGTYPLTLKNAQASDDSSGELDVTVVNGTFQVTVVLDSMRIEPQTAQVACAGMRQFVASGYDHVGPPFTLAAAWAVLPSSLGQIDAGGLFTADNQGTGKIIAVYQTWADTANITVVPGSPLSLNVGPDGLTLVSGTQQLYTVQGFDACDNSFAPTVTWAVHPSSLGTINQSGLFTAGGAGTGWIVATGSPKDSSFVTVIAGSLASVAISPDSSDAVCQGAVQFSATGRDAHGNPVSITPDWTVTPGSLGTINASGLFVAAQVGEGWVIATEGAMADSASLTVGAGSLVSVDIEPDEAILVSGQTQQFSVTGHDACGNLVLFTPQWSVEPQTLGTINSSGLFTAQVAGEGWVFVSGSGSDSAYVFVQKGEAISLHLSPSTRIIPSGQTIVYTAMASDGYNSWDVTDETGFSTTDPSGSFAGNVYTAGSEGDWHNIGTYTFNTTTLSDTADVTVNLEGVCTPGDVDCSGDITPGDALCAFWRSLLGYFQEECDCQCSGQAADVNCTGSITPGDALCIFWRSLLGEWTEECDCSSSMKGIGGTRAIRLQCESIGLKNIMHVRIVVDEPRNLDAFGMELTYPADQLEFQGLVATATTEDWIAVDGQAVEPGRVRIGGFHTNGITSSGAVSLVEAIFTVTGDDAYGQIDAIGLADDLAGASVEKGTFLLTTLPTAYALQQNYPNPFNPTTAINYQIPMTKSQPHVTLKIYNVLGQEVATLVNEIKAAGDYTVEWEASELSSGVYFYRLTAGEFTATRNMLLMK